MSVFCAVVYIFLQYFYAKKLKKIKVPSPAKMQYQPNIASENFEINFMKYFIHKYPTTPETIVPQIIDSQLKERASCKSILING